MPTNDPINFPSTTLILARHGQASGWRNGFYGPDAPLSDLGHRQAAALAERLASGQPPDAVYSSNLPRALETAAAVTARLGLEVKVDSRLAEFDVDMRSATSIHDRVDRLAWHPDHTGADGETLAEFASRVALVHAEIAAGHQRQRVAVISHAGTIEMALRWALGIAPRTAWQAEFEGLRNASISEIEHWPRGVMAGGAPRFSELKRIGDVAHLRGLVTDF